MYQTFLSAIYITVVVVLPLGLFAGGCQKVQNQPPVDEAALAGRATQVQKDSMTTGDSLNSKDDVAAIQPDIILDPDVWYQEWIKQGDAARKKYSGKVVQLNGEVNHVGVDQQVYLKSNGGAVGIQCTTTEREPWARVSRGSKVKIKGRPSSLGLGRLIDCVLVEVGPNPARQITAGDLAKMHEAGQSETFKLVHLIVEGEVKDRKVDKESPQIWLKGSDGIQLEFSMQSAHQIEAIKPGERVTVLALVTSLGPQRIELIGGLVIRAFGKNEVLWV